MEEKVEEGVNEEGVGGLTAISPSHTFHSFFCP